MIILINEGDERNEAYDFYDDFRDSWGFLGCLDGLESGFSTIPLWLSWDGSSKAATAAAAAAAVVWEPRVVGWGKRNHAYGWHMAVLRDYFRVG